MGVGVSHGRPPLLHVLRELVVGEGVVLLDAVAVHLGAGEGD